MVLIPVGNRTRHQFRLWCFLEAFIRLTISVVVLSVVGANELSIEAQRILFVLYSLWSWRPLYIEFKHLYYSWRDAKGEESA